MHSGPILIIEDDEDDQFLLQQMVDELAVPNQLHFFANGQQVLDYLKVTEEQPFIILCDINMPIMNGIELRRLIDESEYLRSKAVPFVFLSTDASPHIIEQAYKTTIQGFFKKGNNYTEATEQLRWIINYWLHCTHPRN